MMHDVMRLWLRYNRFLVHSVSKFKKRSSDNDDNDEEVSYGIGKCLVEEGIIVLSGSCKRQICQSYKTRLDLLDTDLPDSQTTASLTSGRTSGDFRFS